MVEKVEHDIVNCIFKIYTDGEEAGYLTYDKESGTIDIHHTVVDPSFRNRGFGRILVNAALKYAQGEHMEVIPYCSYARVVINE